jgi:hypothetical protein
MRHQVRICSSHPLSPSGRIGYQDYSCQYLQGEARYISVPKEIIVKMLQRENELRLSSKIQMKYKSALLLEGFAGFVRVTEDLQKQVAKEFNLSEVDGLQVWPIGRYNSSYSLIISQILRCGPCLFQSPEEKEEIMNLSLYRKYNRLADGSLVLQSAAPNVDLHLCSGEQLQGGLHSLMLSSAEDGSPSILKPLVLIAGSIS